MKASFTVRPTVGVQRYMWGLALLMDIRDGITLLVGPFWVGLEWGKK